MPGGLGERTSAGLLMYRIVAGHLEVFLAHPGGPFFARKDNGHWSIPKGEPNRGETDLLATAKREFFEEVGIAPAADEFIPLGLVQQKGGKIVRAWAFHGDLPHGHKHQCNTFSIEWPPRSGKLRDFPEIDRVQFFSAADGRQKLKDRQVPFIDRLEAELRGRGVLSGA